MTTGSARASAAMTPTLVLVFVALGGAINAVGGYATTLTGLPLFLDAIGTCLVALVLGPIPGALTAILTSVVLVPISGAGNLAFAIVGVGAAVTWGIGVRQLHLGRTAPRYFALNLLVVLVVSILATPIVLWLFGGGTGHPSDVITAAFARLGPWGAVFADNLLVNTVDKVFTGYIALAAVQALPTNLIQGGAELPGAGKRWVIVTATGIVIGGVLLMALLALRSAGA